VSESKALLKEDSVLRPALILFAICSIAGLILGLAHMVTQKPIESKIDSVNKAALEEVLPEGTDGLKKIEVADGANDGQPILIDQVFQAKGGWAVKVTGKGYASDPIELAVGIDDQGTVTGLSVIRSSESPGLGSHASDPSFRQQYVGKSADQDLVVTKTGASADNEIDAITAATRTTNGVTAAVNRVFAYYRQYLKEGQ
jgi:electron transport complex protein RnfG